NVHFLGPGRLIRSKCSAKFDFYIPQTWDRFPYLLLVTRGEHVHFPPPPTKLPSEIAVEVRSLINQSSLLDLTPRRFLLSPFFVKMYDRFGPAALRALHYSLDIEDKVAALIRKQKLLAYPKGTTIAGVLREWEFDKRRNPDEQWIQDVHFYSQDTFRIICFTYEQAKLFTSAQCIEMDLAFKMIKGSVNVFSITGWSEIENTTLIYAYVFTNIETRKSYAEMFISLFKLLGQVARTTIQFSHIHGDGLQTVTVDMCKKQAPGFGDFLHSLDPTKTWSEHLQHMLIFCRTHLQRNFRKKFGPNHPAGHLVAQIWDMNNKRDILEQMDTMAKLWPELKTWLNSKRKDWILSALTLEQSRISADWWTFARNHTGITESSHFADNEFVGRKQTLLAAVLKTRRRIFEKEAHMHELQKRQLNRAGRDRTEVTRLSYMIKKKDDLNKKAAARRVKDPTRAFNPRNPYDVLNPVMSAPVMPEHDDTNSVSELISIQSYSREGTVVSETPSLPPSRTPQISRRHLRGLSREEEETQAHLERMEKRQRDLEREIEILRRQRELEKELEELRQGGT
ncbi:hypothetical protein ACJ73_09344, partial [Blastomyces percursus]